MNVKVTASAKPRADQHVPHAGVAHQTRGGLRRRCRQGGEGHRQAVVPGAASHLFDEVFLPRHVTPPPGHGDAPRVGRARRLRQGFGAQGRAGRSPWAKAGPDPAVSPLERKAERRQDLLDLGHGHLHAEHARDARPPQAHRARGRRVGADDDLARPRRAHAQLREQLDGTPQGTRRHRRIGAALEPVRRLGRQVEAPPSAPDLGRLEVRALDGDGLRGLRRSPWPRRPSRRQPPARPSRQRSPACRRRAFARSPSSVVSISPAGPSARSGVGPGRRRLGEGGRWCRSRRRAAAGSARAARSW